MADLWVVCLIIGLALAFDFVNGFHDAANSIATVVSTRVLSPRWAVVWAAFFNFVAFLFFKTHVAAAIASGVVDQKLVTLPVAAAALVGAILWNLITWWGGIPSSSSHALVGAVAGAAVVKAGFQALILKSVWEKGIVQMGAFIVLSPLIGFVVGFILMVITYWVFRRWPPARVGWLFRKLQLLSAAAYSLGHGGNDAQKTAGIILLILIAGGRLQTGAEVPTVAVLACYLAMGLGTLAGGWRIVKTMGQKICLLQPVHGFSAESAGALSLYAATFLGIPVSTTHTITGAILGVGSTRGLRAVRWGVAGRVIWAWVLTIPAAALMSAGCWFLFSLLGWK